MPKKFEAESYKKITLDTMMDYIEENFPKDKAWFKSVALVERTNKKGETVVRYSHLDAVREFCKKYAPELIPESKAKKQTAKDKLKNW